MTTTGDLLKMAKEARENAYAKYSDFLVGCAFSTHSGKTYSGCNFENISFGATICAERTAVGSAITAGEQKNRQHFIKDLVVVTQTEDPAPPCGVCLQVLSEFSDDSTTIHLANLDGIVRSAKLTEFLPFQFKNLKD